LRERPEETEFTMGENQQPGPSNETRLIRAGKEKEMAMLVIVTTKIKNEEER